MRLWRHTLWMTSQDEPTSPSCRPRIGRCGQDNVMMTSIHRLERTKHQRSHLHSFHQLPKTEVWLLGMTSSPYVDFVAWCTLGRTALTVLHEPLLLENRNNPSRGGLKMFTASIVLQQGLAVSLALSLNLFLPFSLPKYLS